MKETKYLLAKVHQKIQNGNKEVISAYFRKAGMKVGTHCNICCNIMTSEPYLVDIGNNVTIAGNVTFVTHDNSISKIDHSKSDIFGRIRIGNNCFIGSNSTILYGITIPNNTIIAAGSIVTHSFQEENTVIGGNPAHVLCEWSELEKRNACHFVNVKEMSEEQKKDFLLNHANLISR